VREDEDADILFVTLEGVQCGERDASRWVRNGYWKLPIPSLAGITADGRFGKVSRFTLRQSVCEVAVEMKWQLWENRRKSLAIAEYWRPLVSPVGVAKRALEKLHSNPGDVTKRRQ